MSALLPFRCACGHPLAQHENDARTWCTARSCWCLRFNAVEVTE